MSSDLTLLEKNILETEDGLERLVEEGESNNDKTDETDETVDADEYFNTKQAKDLDMIGGVFRNRIKLLRKTIDRVHPELEEEHKRDLSLIEEVISKFKEEDANEVDYDRILSILQTSNIPYVSVFIKGMFLNIFSELDTFTSNYLCALFNLKPEVISGNQKQFNASEVFECSSLDNFREKVIQKEIDGIKRESYVEQIEILEKTFNIKTLKNFKNWSKYVEATQRRNIIMHCDGEVTEQYYDICNKNGSGEYAKVGDKLEVDYKYLKMSISIIEEVSVKLIQVLWRKCFPDKVSQDEFDQILNDYMFQLLIDEEWEVAMELGSFACDVINPTTGQYKMMFLINRCIALNNLEKQKETIKLLNKVDFSAIDREFLLAKYVLINDVDNVIKLMHDIGDKGEYFTRHAYTAFPLFKQVRQNKKFQLSYKEIFGEDIIKEEIKLKIKETEEDITNIEDTEKNI